MSKEQKLDISLIKERLGSDIADVMSKFIESRVKQKTEVSFYTGKIVANDDPDQQGKCRIRVYGVFGDEIPDGDLPWAVPDFQFIGSTLGSFVVPPIDAIVKVYFDQGDFHSPRYTTKVFNTSNLSSFSAGVSTNYPNNMILFETDAGEYLTINRETNLTTYRHASGAIITIDESGNITLDTTPADTGDVTWNIKGNLDINVTGDITMNSNGSTDIEATTSLGTKAGTTAVHEATTSIAVESIDTTLKGSAFVHIKHPQGPLWFPNALPVDPASQAVHGGLPLITTLLSETP